MRDGRVMLGSDMVNLVVVNSVYNSVVPLKSLQSIHVLWVNQKC